MIYASTYKQNLNVSNKYHDTFNDIFQDDELMQDYEHFLIINQVNIINKTNEFEQYLADPLVPSSYLVSFNNLAWWKENTLKYPSVSLMARDILAILITSVASETVSKVLIKY